MGMRNAKNSWSRSDSEIKYENIRDSEGYLELGPNDYALMMKLTKGGPVHAKYRRMITVLATITAPLYWWKEFDTYKVGTVANSCSTMHKIHEKEFTLEDFSCEHLLNDKASLDDEYTTVDVDGVHMQCSAMDVLNYTIETLNLFRNKYLHTKDKLYWWQMIQLLPSSYNQKRTVQLNYEVLANIYTWRKNHKLDCWIEFCKWIESLPYSEIITGKESEDNG
jgi:hypothetical protein